METNQQNVDQDIDIESAPAEAVVTATTTTLSQEHTTNQSSPAGLLSPVSNIGSGIKIYL